MAPYFKNRELKKAIPCTDYKLTEVRKHALQHGPGANAPAQQPVKRFRILPEDLAFVVNFLPNPENTCRSSHRMPSCQGKKSSWVSDLFPEDQQPVMWLKDGKSHLYEKYKEECLKLGRKPISGSKFLNGLSAGIFKDMREMAGLCNICDELGAPNWKKLTELIEALRNEITGVPPTVDTEESNIAAEDENNDDLTSGITIM